MVTFQRTSTADWYLHCQLTGIAFLIIGLFPFFLYNYIFTFLDPLIIMNYTIYIYKQLFVSTYM